MTNFEVRRNCAFAEVVPAGDVVLSSVSALRPAMRDLLRSGVRELVFDLEHAQMIDSTGIGLLLAAHNSLSAVGGKFSVVRASEEILQLLRTMRVHQHFSVSGRTVSQ